MRTVILGRAVVSSSPSRPAGENLRFQAKQQLFDRK